MEALLTQDRIGQHPELSNPIDPSVLESLSIRAKYRPSPSSESSYGSAEQNIAMALALDTVGPLSMVPVIDRDWAWETNGCSTVRRYKFEDGTAAYFKPLRENSEMEYAFRDYGTSSLGAAINELNSYRMAQLLGPLYKSLITETVFRELDGSLGSLQREVIEYTDLDRGFDSPMMMEDYRRASLLDFVIGNLDRHNENFLYGMDTLGRCRLRLIDNSFSFPGFSRTWFLNESIFADNLPHLGYGAGYQMRYWDLELKLEERIALERARSGVESWLTEGTIAIQKGRSALKRIDHLLTVGRLGGISTYFEN